MSEFHVQLAFLLQSTGMTASELADNLGVSASTVHNWLHKGFKPRGATLVALCRVFNVSEHWLLYGGKQGKVQESESSVSVPLFSLQTGRMQGSIEYHESDISGNATDYVSVICHKRVNEIIPAESKLLFNKACDFDGPTLCLYKLRGKPVIKMLDAMNDSVIGTLESATIYKFN